MVTQLDKPGVTVGLWNGTHYLTWVVTADGYRCYADGFELDPKAWDARMPAGLQTHALCAWAKKAVR